MKKISSALRVVFTVFMVLMCVSVLLKLADAGPHMFRAGKLADRSITVDYAHHEIHEGNHYVAFHNAPLGSGAKYQLLINTPATGDIHLLLCSRGSAESNIVFSEAATVSNVGAAHTVVNRNRLSANTSGVAVTLGPTITGLGTILMETHFGSGPNIGGEPRATNEFVLKRSTLYIINATSEGSSNDLSVLADFYKASGDAP